MGIAKRVVQQLGANYGKYGGINASRVPVNGGSTSFYSSVSNNSCANKCDYRQISQLVQSNANKRAFLVDTLALVRRLESQGVPSKQAEAITSAITEVLNDSLENVAQSFVASIDKQKEHHFSMLQRETETRRSDIDKMRSELKYEIDKLTAGQRLDLNLERGRIRDELVVQNNEIATLKNKNDGDVNALRTQLEAAKYEVIKYCIGTLVSISAICLAVARLYI